MIKVRGDDINFTFHPIDLAVWSTLSVIFYSTFQGSAHHSYKFIHLVTFFKTRHEYIQLYGEFYKKITCSIILAKFQTSDET